MLLVFSERYLKDNSAEHQQWRKEMPAVTLLHFTTC